MCSNYDAVTKIDRLLEFFGVERDPSKPLLEVTEVWPTGYAPFVRLAEDGSGNRVCDVGTFGLLPDFATEVAFGRKTYNARSETVHSRPSYRDAWARGQRCIIPAETLYEMSWETGRPVRIGVRQEGTPLGVAGIYHSWTDPKTDVTRGTFAMLTVNADGHPLYSRFAAPGKEKRMVVILHPDDYGAWLSCTPQEARKFFKQWQGILIPFEKPLRPHI